MSILEKLQGFGSVEIAGRQVPVIVLGVGGVAALALYVRSRGGDGGGALGGNSPGRNAQIDEAAARTIEAVGNAQDYLAGQAETQQKSLLDRLGLLETALTGQNQAFADSLGATAGALRDQLAQQGIDLQGEIGRGNASILDTIGNLVSQINQGFAVQNDAIDAVARNADANNTSLANSLGTLWNSFNALFQQVNSTPA